MIRSGFSSPLRFVLARPSLVAPSSSSSSSSLRRPFSLSSPSFADGLFPVHPKQGINDIDSMEPNTVENESIEAPKEKLALEEGGKVDVAAPSSSSSNEEITSSSTSSSSTPSTPTSDAPISTSSSSKDSPPHTTADDSDPSSSSSSEPTPTSLLSSPISFSSFQPPQLIPDALQDLRRSIPSVVTPQQWAALKGPRSQVKVVRLSLRCTKNNTQGLLSWHYDPAVFAHQQDQTNNLLPNGKFTGGSLGFKGAASGGSEAGHQVVVALFKRLKEENEKVLEERRAAMEARGEREGYLPDPVGVQVRLNVSGFGQGREAFMKALKSEEGSLVRQLAVAISDHTPIARSWPRPKQPRRV